jgi:hypothetical protein
LTRSQRWALISLALEKYTLLTCVLGIHILVTLPVTILELFIEAFLVAPEVVCLCEDRLALVCCDSRHGNFVIDEDAMCGDESNPEKDYMEKAVPLRSPSLGCILGRSPSVGPGA